MHFFPPPKIDVKTPPHFHIIFINHNESKTPKGVVTIYVTGSLNQGGDFFYKKNRRVKFFLNINQGGQFSLMCINALKMGIVCILGVFDSL